MDMVQQFDGHMSPGVACANSPMFMYMVQSCMHIITEQFRHSLEITHLDTAVQATHRTLQKKVWSYFPGYQSQGNGPILHS